MEKIRINFCSSNKHKYREVAAILGDQFDLIHRPVEVPEIQGEARDILMRKLADAYAVVKEPCIVEDVSLCFNAFNGLPGPYIKDFLTKMGSNALYKALENFEDKTASAICTIGYADENVIEIFQGIVKGKIVEPREKEAFGWDGIFEVDGTGKTYNEMGEEEKNKISHRFHAVNKLKNYIMELHKK
ncbi:inosine triphosphate pyrophosphatase (HAM1) family protein [Babesia bovis T2Bo]|uniref:inosine triphosphate pyrophosphatase (HAM1) family protein n=1 Tax=Babesia bovis T2Bo TaxID=484906 RepID=UPI001C34DBC7|nr:inosine triphosphate pyrophosphatase (HAM1) family protein [Babesia bovis T2Bo]EDO07712.2 inosine triphosphate pyrophosphatase (HAM1) family protein [Babesia bovis T2Bo]